jgi:hypothetical protein
MTVFYGKCNLKEEAVGMERHRKNNTTDKLALVLNGYKVIG